MKRFQRSVCAGLLLAGLIVVAIPAAGAQATGCSNVTLQGTYGVQMSTPASAAGGAAAAASAQAGSISIGGPVAGFGRIYLDGAGNVTGRASSSVSGSVLSNDVIGTYSVSNDCRATMRITNPVGTTQSFEGVIVLGGSEVLMLQTDSGGPGITADLVRGRNICSATDFAGSYGFRSTSEAVAGSAFPAHYSSVGVIGADGNGNFYVIESRNSGGNISRVTTTGTY